MESKLRGENIVRVLFDDHIYKHVSRKAFEASSRCRASSKIQVADHGKGHIEVRIKTEGVNERIG
jgi:hypothetical protein